MSQLCIPVLYSFFFYILGDTLRQILDIDEFFSGDICGIKSTDLVLLITLQLSIKFVCTVYVPKCRIAVFALFSDSAVDNLLHTSGVSKIHSSLTELGCSLTSRELNLILVALAPAVYLARLERLHLKWIRLK